MMLKDGTWVESIPLQQRRRIKEEACHIAVLALWWERPHSRVRKQGIMSGGSEVERL